jgi:uncharacterized RDD family membrane protein YckC
MTPSEPQVPPPADPATTVSPAGAGVRAGARVLDALVVGIPVSIVLAVAGLPPQMVGLGGLDAWLQSAVTSLAWLAYYVGFETSRGATLGKRILRLRVVDAQGVPPGPAAATLRNLWLLLGLVPWVGGPALVATVVAILVGVARAGDRRGAHDRLAGTQVVRAAAVP